MSLKQIYIWQKIAHPKTQLSWTETAMSLHLNLQATHPPSWHSSIQYHYRGPISMQLLKVHKRGNPFLTKRSLMLLVLDLERVDMSKAFVRIGAVGALCNCTYDL